MSSSTSRVSPVVDSSGQAPAVPSEMSAAALDSNDPWLFSEDTFILKLPSRLQLKLLVSQELKARESLNDFVIKLASRLKLDGPTILCATVLLNRYYMRVPLLLSKYFVASAAIVISGKLNDTYRSPDKVALQAAVLKNPMPGQLVDEHCDLFWRWRDQILYREELILKTLNFDLAFTLPYSIRDTLFEESDPELLLFTEKKTHILKNALALIEVLSLLPILIAYDIHTLFGAALVVIILEGRKIFGDDSLILPRNYLHLRLGTSTKACFNCYRYIMRFIKYSLCDPAALSNKAAYKRLRPIAQQTFFMAANESGATISEHFDEKKGGGDQEEAPTTLSGKDGALTIGDGQLDSADYKQQSSHDSTVSITDPSGTNSPAETKKVAEDSAKELDDPSEREARLAGVSVEKRNLNEHTEDVVGSSNCDEFAVAQSEVNGDIKTLADTTNETKGSIGPGKDARNLANTSVIATESKVQNGAAEKSVHITDQAARLDESHEPAIDSNDSTDARTSHEIESVAKLAIPLKAGDAIGGPKVGLKRPGEGQNDSNIAHKFQRSGNGTEIFSAEN